MLPCDDGGVRLDDVPREWLAACAIAAVVWALILSWGAWWRSFRRRRRFERGSEGEREAALLLEANGFVIEGAQVEAAYDLFVDGEATTTRVRADYVVARRGRRFVAEVKTGRMATRIETPATRRQLLEYEHAFAVDGVLLVDADARKIRAISFATRPEGGGMSRILVLAFAAALAAGIVAIVHQRG